MTEIFGTKGWQIVKIGVGVLLILLAIALPFILEPAEKARLADLETSGVHAMAHVTSVVVSAVQAPHGKSAVGTYMVMRGLGASRKLSAGAALIQRSNNKSAHREAAYGPTYYDIEYEFPFGEGYVSGSDRLKLMRSDAIDTGAEITIILDPRNPSIHRLPAYSEPTQHISPGLKYGLPGLVAILGAFFLWWGMQDSEAGSGDRCADAAAAAYATSPRMAAAPMPRRPAPGITPRQPAAAVAPRQASTASPAASRLDFALRGTSKGFNRPVRA